MCGIFFSLRYDASALDKKDKEPEEKRADSIFANLRQSNAERGPDYQSSVVKRLHKVGFNIPGLVAEFFGAELRLRGDAAIQQPHQRGGNILCWNGEAFGGLKISAQENDGVKLMDELEKAKDADGVLEVFGRLEGPYAFVFYHEASRRIYFSRDPLGRRSLLVHKPTPEFPALLISSVSAGLDCGLSFDELSTERVHCIDLAELEEAQLKPPSDIAGSIEGAIHELPRCPPGFSLPYTTPARLNIVLPPEDLPLPRSLDEIPDHLVTTVDEFFDVLDRSTYLQVRDIPRIGPEDSARVSVLFSGGIDSTVVAYLAHKHIPFDEPIDLFNVGFENPRKMRLEQAGNVGALPKRQQKRERAALESTPLPTAPSYRVPDRVTGLQELEELRRLCPGRVWNFVEINVPYEECQRLKQKVEDLMLPSRTVMDLSLALALYFAARGKGHIRSNPAADPVPYTSPARVVLSGLGSDELLGGYGRHRSAYNTGGWSAVIEELQLEIDRIPTRNLGRDDRMISSHGKETRHPFLSLDVVNFLARLPVHHKLDPRMEIGLGDKTLLRLLVRKLGLVEASCRKKRAMQFGSHSARMDGEKKGDVPLDDQ